MSCGLNGDAHLLLTGKAHSFHHVGGFLGGDDCGRVLIDRKVPRLPRRRILKIIGGDYLPLYASLKVRPPVGDKSCDRGCLQQFHVSSPLHFFQSESPNPPGVYTAVELITGVFAGEETPVINQSEV
jgi:hypothetical protein